MFRKLRPVLLGLALMALVGSQAFADSYHVEFDFETGWSGDYAPGWENTLYRHGEAPLGKMMQQVPGGKDSGNALKLAVASAPQDWMWWAIVNPIEVNSSFMAKKYDPWVSVDYFDSGWDNSSDAKQATGQLYAVPTWVNPWIDGTEDWTDVQFGGRFNQAPTADDYYYVAAGQNSPGWVTTDKPRADGAWVNMKMQLLSADGKIHFFLNDIHVGASYRDDYTDLLGIALATMYEPKLSEWEEAPFVIYDNFQFGSSAVPLPAAAWAGMLLMGGLAGVRVLRRKRQTKLARP